MVAKDEFRPEENVVDPIATNLVPDGDESKSPCTNRESLQTKNAPPTGNNSSLQDSGRKLGTLTGVTLLASTPCNWQVY